MKITEKDDIEKLTIEELFEERRFSAEETMQLYAECKNTSQFFIEKAEYHSMFVKTNPAMIDALIEFLLGEVRRFKAEMELLVKNMQDNYILPVIKFPNFLDVENNWERICKMEIKASLKGYSSLFALKIVIKELQNSLFPIQNINLFFPPSNIEDLFNVLKDKYEKEHIERLKIYIEDFESVEAVKASLREEYKDDKAVKCWKDCAHDIKKTITSMNNAGCVERDLLPLFEYITKCKMMEDKSNMHNFVSAFNNGLTPRKKSRGQSTTTVNIYDCPSVNIGQAQDIISEGGIKNVYNHKKQ